MSKAPYVIQAGGLRIEIDLASQPPRLRDEILTWGKPANGLEWFEWLNRYNAASVKFTEAPPDRQESIKFTDDQLEDYLSSEFSKRQDFCPRYKGWSLTQNQRSGGCFVHTDKQGAPSLDDRFVDFMDETTYDLVVPFGRIKEALLSMRISDPVEAWERRSNDNYDVLLWVIRDQPAGRSAEWYAEQIGRDRSTVFRRKARALDRLKNAILASFEEEEILPPPVRLQKRD